MQHGCSAHQHEGTAPVVSVTDGLGSAHVQLPQIFDAEFVSPCGGEQSGSGIGDIQRREIIRVAAGDIAGTGGECLQLPAQGIKLYPSFCVGYFEADIAGC